MNYRQARQLETTGKFHYTNQNDDRIYPIGYCQENCPGHNTAEEACEHYKQYLLDKRLNFDAGTIYSSLEKCQAEECPEYTNKITSLGGVRNFFLCDNHRNRETVSKLLTVGEEISSF